MVDGASQLPFVRHSSKMVRPLLFGTRSHTPVLGYRVLLWWWSTQNLMETPTFVAVWMIRCDLVVGRGLKRQGKQCPTLPF
jgi:hypothetical protein